MRKGLDLKGKDARIALINELPPIIRKKMKQILFITLLIYATEGYSQEGFKFIILDNVGRTDTVVFGMDYSATTGVDSELGEVNLYETTIDSIEIRSVMRDLNSHLCLTSSRFENSGDPLVFSENVDLKIDFREFTLFSPLNNNFEFKINAIENPLTIISDFSQWHPMGTWGIWIGLVDSNCVILASQYGNEDEIDTLIIDENSVVKSIIVKFDHEVGINDISNSSILKLYPNPNNNVSILEINIADTQNDQISIYNMNGQLVLSQKLNGLNKTEINKSDFQPGLYYLKYLGQNGYCEMTKMIIE